MKKARTQLLKRVVSVAASVTLALTLLPAQALAIGEITEWSPPAKAATSYQKDGKTYSYIKSAGHRRVEAVADYLGISNVTVQPKRTGKAFPYQESAAEAYEIAAKTGRMGIFGTEVNENLNPWYGNLFYNIAQERDGKDDRAAQDDVLVYTLENNGPNSADTDIIDEYGTSASLFLRPDILFGAGSITDANGEPLVIGNAGAGAQSGYTELVNKIRNKELGTYNDVDLYKAGDENYDPWYVPMSASGPAREDIYMLYNLASAAENIIAATKDTDNPKVTRYGSPMEIANLFEEWILGTQMAIVKAIDEGKVQKKTVGVVSGIDAESGKVTFRPTGDNGNFQYLQEVCNNIIDVAKLEGGVGGAEDLMKCSAIYLDGTDQKNQIITIFQEGGFNDPNAYPDIYTTGPDAVLQTSHEAEACMAYGYLIGFAYPEIINPVDAVAFYYRAFYHIKAGRLADALGMQVANMSLPAGVELNLNNFNEESFRAMLDEAVLYLDANKETVTEDDETITRAKGHESIVISEYFKMPEQKAEPVDPEPTPTPAVAKKANTLKATGKTVNLKAKNLKKKAQNITKAKAYTVKNAKGTLSYKLGGVVKAKFKKYFKVNAKNGKITVKKGLKKGTYKVKVKITAKGNSSFKSGTKTATVTVKVK